MSYQTALLLACLLVVVSGHGRVLKPPGRGTAWRFGFPTMPNYDDDGMNCGGFSHQWEYNGGKCGICGDPYDRPSPRAHEIGGIYGDGTIVARYLPGSTITLNVQLTAYHRGFWEFKLCPDPDSNEQECFDQYPLELEDGGTKYYPTRGSATYTVKYILPDALDCQHCVLQWRYTAGNNWGVCSNGTQGLGCGNQEQFGACSDIQIGSLLDVDSYVSGQKAGLYEKGQSPLLYILGHGYFDKQQGENDFDVSGNNIDDVSASCD